MIARIKRSGKETAGDDLHKRIRELRAATDHFVPEGGMESLRLWEMFMDFKVLPYAGGWLDQPEWFRRDCENFWLIAELAKLMEKLPAAKPGMKTMDQLIGAHNG